MIVAAQRRQLALRKVPSLWPRQLLLEELSIGRRSVSHSSGLTNLTAQRCPVTSWAASAKASVQLR